MDHKKNTTFKSTDRVKNVAELATYYRERARTREEMKVGVEWERFGVYRDTLEVVPYEGDRGYRAVLQFLHDHKGWEIEDADGKNIFTLLRGLSRTTVEGDGKPEISAAPHASLFELAREIKNHADEIEEISKTLGIAWVPLGLHPYAGQEDIPLVPKKRYHLWDRIFPNHHEWMHTYMKALSGIHFNIDYTNEENMLKKAKLLTRLSPLMAALFANSPYERGRVAPCLGMRRHHIFHGGPGQERAPEGMFSDSFDLVAWLTWYTEQRLIIFPFDQDIVTPSEWTFATWMERGYEGRFPTFSDFDQHVKTRWTDIRFRPGYLEYRVIDTVPLPLLMSGAALMKGVVFNPKGCDEADALTTGWSEEVQHTLHRAGCTLALRTSDGHATFRTTAKQLVAIAKKNLTELYTEGVTDRNESIFLAPLEALIERGVSPAEDLLTFTGGDSKRILEWVEHLEHTYPVT